MGWQAMAACGCGLRAGLCAAAGRPGGNRVAAGRSRRGPRL